MPHNRASAAPSYLRALIGFVLGLVITTIGIVAKVGFPVNAPRAAHPVLLVLLFAVPAAVGGLIGFMWRQGSTRR